MKRVGIYVVIFLAALSICSTALAEFSLTERMKLRKVQAAKKKGDKGLKFL
jgi:hypothetical protein